MADCGSVTAKRPAATIFLTAPSTFSIACSSTSMSVPEYPPTMRTAFRVTCVRDNSRCPGSGSLAFFGSNSLPLSGCLKIPIGFASAS